MNLAISLLRRSVTGHGRQQGFTLIELLVVILMAGILASIAAPGWLGYLYKRRVGTTQD
ncbi:MAG: prepilin-type N-terminal cleavage/methylation domain-containing protein, partial [Cyanobacteria bacterium J06554_1]